MLPMWREHGPAGAKGKPDAGPAKISASGFGFNEPVGAHRGFANALSARLKAAMWRAEDDARPALERLLAELDAESGTAAAE